MTTMLSETEAAQAPPVEPAPHETLPLEDRMPEWFRAPGRVAGYAAAVAVVYFLFSIMPLWHTDVWGHLAYGRVLWEASSIPAIEPLMPLAAGMPFVDTAWLSQVVGYRIMETWGTAGMRFLYAAPIVLCCALLLIRTNRPSRSAWFPVLGMTAFLWTSYEQLIVIRPQLGGLACFVALLFLLTRRPWPRAGWVLVPALFALWVNLHGSFLVGLGVLGTFVIGRWIDVARRTRSMSRAFRDDAVRRTFVLLELAFLATLLNPYGLAIYPEVLTFSQNPNLADLGEWLPLSLRMSQGKAAAVLALALAVLYRWSPRRISATEALVVGGLGVAALWTSRMIVWWSPVAAYYFTLHAGAVWEKMAASWRRAASRSRRTLRDDIVHTHEIGSRSGPAALHRSYWTVMAGGFLFLSFLFSPFGQRVFHGARPEQRNSLSRLTPVEATDYLRKQPPQGLVYNSYEYGDWILWAGPEGTQPFVSSHVHLIPREVWQDHDHISRVASGWSDLLDGYGINTMILSRVDDRALIAAARRSEEWDVRYQDEYSAVLMRRPRPESAAAAAH